MDAPSPAAVAVVVPIAVPAIVAPVVAVRVIATEQAATRTPGTVVAIRWWRRSNLIDDHAPLALLADDSRIPGVDPGVAAGRHRSRRRRCNYGAVLVSHVALLSRIAFVMDLTAAQQTEEIE